MRNSYNKMLQQFESVTKFEYGKSANDFFQVAINENSKIVEEVGEIGIKAIDFYNRLDLTLMSITDYPVINNHLNPD